VLLQLLQQLLRVNVVWVCGQRFLCVLKTVSELSQLKCEQAIVESGLEEMGPEVDRTLEMILRLLYIPFPELQHTQVVVAFRMGGVHGYGDFKRLIGQSQITHTYCNVADVVPHIRHVGVVGQHKRSLKTRQRQIVLPRIETTKPQVVPQFRRFLLTCLQEPPVKS